MRYVRGVDQCCVVDGASLLCQATLQGRAAATGRGVETARTRGHMLTHTNTQLFRF